MKTGWNKKRRRQQQSGRPVVVTFYVARPARDGGASATASAHDVRSHRRESSPRGSKPKAGGGSFDRRAELLEYSRQLRALARRGTAAAQPAPSPRSRCSDTVTVGVVPDADPPAAENRLSLAGRRRERDRSQQQQQQIKQRCCGSGAWSWKRVLVLVFPFHRSSHNMSKRPRRHDDGRESNRKGSQKGWPAALLVGKLTVSRTGRDHSGLGKKLMSVFRRQS